jgi:hypothetical protein
MSDARRNTRWAHLYDPIQPQSGLEIKRVTEQMRCNDPMMKMVTMMSVGVVLIPNTLSSREQKNVFAEETDSRCGYGKTG